MYVLGRTKGAVPNTLACTEGGLFVVTSTWRWIPVLARWWSLVRDVYGPGADGLRHPVERLPPCMWSSWDCEECIRRINDLVVVCSPTDAVSFRHTWPLALEFSSSPMESQLTFTASRLPLCRFPLLRLLVRLDLSWLSVSGFEAPGLRCVMPLLFSSHVVYSRCLCIREVGPPQLCGFWV